MSTNGIPATSVSLTLMVGNGWEASFQCLLALVQRSGGVRRETIAVDNGSTDDTQRALPLLEGLKVVRCETEQAFGPAANRAAAVAAGDVLLFLDRDAEVQEGWLPPLASLFDDPAVAAAVPTEESGLSGAFLAVRLADLRQAGGFDESRPEATDLLLSGFLDRGRRVELVASAALRMRVPGAAPGRPALSVVLPVRDAARTIQACLEGLSRSLRDGDEVVIADGGSADDTLRAAYAFAAQNPRSVRVLAGGEGGMAAAAREGLAAATRDLAVVLHASVQPPEGFLDGLHALLTGNPGSQAVAIEVPRTGVCVAGPLPLLRAVSGTDAGSLFHADGVALAQAVGRAGAKLAFVPASG